MIKIKHKKPVFWLISTLIALILMVFVRLGTSYYLSWSYENQILSKYPVFKLLSDKSPLDFNNYIRQVRSSLLSNKGDRVPFFTGEYIYSQLKKYSPYASNQDFYNLAKTTFTFYNQVFSQNPSLVLNLEFNILSTQEELKFEKLYSKDASLINPITQAKESIIESAINKPQPVLTQSDKDKAQIIINSIMIDLSIDYGNQAVYNTFNHPDDPHLDQKLSAEIIIKFYQMLLNHGSEDGGLTIKYLYSSAQSQTARK